MNIPPPRITALRVRNYRALRDLALAELTPLTVLMGPNGSGKSTVFDVFAFLSECFTDGVRKAWDRRGRFRELRSRGGEGPILVEFKYRENAERRSSRSIWNSTKKAGVRWSTTNFCAGRAAADRAGPSTSWSIGVAKARSSPAKRRSIRTSA